METKTVRTILTGRLPTSPASRVFERINVLGIDY